MLLHCSHLKCFILWDSHRTISSIETVWIKALPALTIHIISYHLLFASIYVYIFYTLYFYVSCFVIFIEWVHIWFSKELIFLCGQKSAGFYPKLKVVFHHWQSVVCEVCHIGHLLNSFQMEIINSVGINSYLVEMDHKLSQKRYICKPD